MSDLKALRKTNNLPPDLPANDSDFLAVDTLMSDNSNLTQKYQDNDSLLTVSVKNFGPIADAKVDIRPLTIFLGRSNSGKTYLAKLIYAIHQTFSGYPQLPLINGNEYLFRQLYDQLTSRIIQKQGLQVSQKEIRDSILDSFEFNKSEAADHLVKEILSCFGASHMSTLRRANARNGPLQIEVSHSIRKQLAWQISLKYQGAESSQSAKLNSSSIQFNEPHFNNLMSATRNCFVESGTSGTSPSLTIDNANSQGLLEIYRKLVLLLAYPDSKFPQNSFFLPANRGGILESFKFIADVWFAQIPKLGLEEIPTTHALHKSSVDFIRKMMSLEDRSPLSECDSLNECVRGIEDAATFLEQSVLEGSLRNVKHTSATIPEFEFVPKNSRRAFKLNSSSAMVSELTPLVVFLRAHVNPYDTIIIEEPEAHMHAGTMPKLAQCLALLVRNNVRVLIATHSGWLLKSIRNLVLKGDILTDGTSDTKYKWHLLRHELSAWEFHQSKHASGIAVTSIPFDEIDGIEPKDIGMIDDSLFNESAAYRSIRKTRQRQ